MYRIGVKKIAGILFLAVALAVIPAQASIADEQAAFEKANLAVENQSFVTTVGAPQSAGTDLVEKLAMIERIKQEQVKWVWGNVTSQGVEGDAFWAIYDGRKEAGSKYPSMVLMINLATGNFTAVDYNEYAAVKGYYEKKL